MSAGVSIDRSQVAAVIWAAGAGVNITEAELLARNLTERGYVLVACSGPALEQAIEQAATLPPASPERAQQIERWCDPSRTS